MNEVVMGGSGTAYVPEIDPSTITGIWSAPGQTYYVDLVRGSDAAVNDGKSWPRAFATIGAAVAVMLPGDNCKIAPGSYDEAITLARTLSANIFEGCGPRGSVSIECSTAATVALTVNADDITLKNVGVSAQSGAAFALRVTGSRFRGYACKAEGPDGAGKAAIGFGPGSAAAVAAGSAGDGGDFLIDDCELAYANDGIQFVASDYGAATQILLRNIRIHNCPGVHVKGVPGAFGIGSVRNLEVLDSAFDRSEDGTKPSDFVKVDDAADTGLFAGNRFALATNAAADLKIAAGVLWVANETEAGVSAARPS